MGDAFEWDDAKAKSNLKKHNVSFKAALGIFDDVFALERIDRSMAYGEDRFAVTGIVNGVMLTVIYTERNGRTRIISARKATKHEEREYYRRQTEG